MSVIYVSYDLYYSGAMERNNIISNVSSHIRNVNNRIVYLNKSYHN